MIQPARDLLAVAQCHLKAERNVLGFGVRRKRVLKAVREPLADNGLSFVQLLGSNGEGITLRTMLLHESGQFLEGIVAIDPGDGNRGVNALQALGAAITYMKRYSLTAMLGIAADGDTDGEGSQAKAAPRRQEQPAPPVERPLDGPAVRAAVRRKAKWQRGEVRIEGEPITDKQVKMVAGLMADAVKGPGMNQAMMDKARHDIMDYLLGVNETHRLTKLEASAIIDWLKEADGWDLNEYGRAEAQAVLNALAEEAGQQRMDL